MVKVEIHGVPAYVQDYRWHCLDGDMLTLLNGVKDRFGPSGADPHPDRTLADNAVKQLGGKVIAA